MKKIMNLLAVVALDKRISVCHLTVFTAVLQVFYQSGLCNPVAITRRRIMELSRISSTATYHKCLKDLEQFGYIKYVPSYHPKFGSEVFLDFRS